MNRAVPDHGPYDALLLIVGEAGGKEEGAKGRPFVGATGRKVRELVKASGLDPERDVRYANVIPVEMATLPKTPHAMQAVVRTHWNSIEATLLRGEHKAVLSYGRAALWRLTGRTKITDEHGSVSHIEVGGRRVPMVASIHPASVMRSKIEAGWTLVRAATDRACRYASGALVFDASRQEPEHRWHYDGDEALAIRDVALRTKAPVSIDCEYDRDTKRPFLIGVSVDGETVASFVPTPEAIAGLRVLCDDANIVKLYHHAPADFASLATVGIGLRPPVVDTLMLYATIFPDLPVGLARVALHLFDHWYEWKGMAHDDPKYNAIDVVATWRAYALLHPMMTAGNLWPVWDREVRHVGVLCMAMEARGLCVDPAAQRAAVGDNAVAQERLRFEVGEHVEAMFAKRRAPLEARLVAVLEEIKGYEQFKLAFPCIEHPNYTGLVKPRGKDRGNCICAATYPLLEKERADLRDARKERDGLTTKIERWSKGFDLGNNDHLRWLLYDADGFKLPAQKKDGRITANADAIARLLALKKVQESPAMRTVLVGVKEYQHLRKMTNTFLLWNEGDDRPSDAIDSNGVAHPEYRPFGTGTGRLAGGPDSDLGDRRTNPYAYNALNIPEETRRIYVPHPAAFTVDVTTAMREVIDEDDEDNGE